MAECPSCHSQVSIGPEFFGGLFTCPRCQAVYFISFDGVPEVAQPHAPASSPELNSSPASYEPQFSSLPEEPVPEPSPNDYDSAGSSTDYAALGPQDSADAYESYEESSANAMDSNDSGYQAFAPTIPNNSNPLQEIVDFGNSETVGTALTYRLLIKGLDIVQHIEELRDVLSDSKLGIRFEEIKSKIKNGQLLIDRIEASQAAVLAQRLRTLPIEMVWEQRIYE